MIIIIKCIIDEKNFPNNKLPKIRNDNIYMGYLFLSLLWRIHISKFGKFFHISVVSQQAHSHTNTHTLHMSLYIHGIHN